LRSNPSQSGKFCPSELANEAHHICSDGNGFARLLSPQILRRDLGNAEPQRGSCGGQRMETARVGLRLTQCGLQVSVGPFDFGNVIAARIRDRTSLAFSHALIRNWTARPGTVNSVEKRATRANCSTRAPGHYEGRYARRPLMSPAAPLTGSIVFSLSYSRSLPALLSFSRGMIADAGPRCV
jgi:hypothetical protein